MAGIWGPFAGYGARGRHVSWLLDDLGYKAEDLHRAITDRFHNRSIPGSDMRWMNLIAKGLLVERRPFYFVRRGITTIALYIAHFGQDLYISQVTYMKGPISNARVLILALMLLFFVFYSSVYPGLLVDRLTSFLADLVDVLGVRRGSPFPFFLLCIIGPLGLLNYLLLGLALLYSVYKWLRDKNLLALLRARPNEFQEDDTIALEKAVEETVRQSLDAIGIDSSLMPPVSESHTRGLII